jgi:hypothetical protein
VLDNFSESKVREKLSLVVFKKWPHKPGVVIQACNSSTWEPEGGRSQV